MASTTLGVKVDDLLRARLKDAAARIERTPHWLIKQAIFAYLEKIERGQLPPELAGPQGATGLADGALETGEADEDSAAHPFLEFAQSVQPQSVLRAAITAAYRRPEPECVPFLVGEAKLPANVAADVEKMAAGLVGALRAKRTGGGVEGLIHEFSLSSQEGVALMCLAEALLRIPDRATRDALIRDKISKGDWKSHVGHAPSLFVNAATWGLMITGKLVTTTSEAGLSAALARLIGKGGEPLIRKGVDMAMRLMGEQFVTGENISGALANSRKYEARGFRYSYDMLGEAATTEADAQRYYASYEQAIHAIGKAALGRGIYEGPGISIKLSALHPRYARAQQERALGELLPRVRMLAILARHYDIGLNIDAEEADRLELSLDLLEALCFDAELAGWNGIGFVVQGYQKRCPFVIDYLIDLARRSRHRLMVRLVKGAYWDSEIKRAQVDGLEGYPVYTRKIYTDVSYLACAKKLLAAPDAVYPQFATHNAWTLAAIYHLAGRNYYPGQYEFQCLHGMGEPLYEEVSGREKLNRPCRIYAPVGSHETLLAYLVRRLLENGANTSFVNRIADAGIPIAELVASPVDEAAQVAPPGSPHPKIALPRELYGAERANSMGLDLSNEHRLASLSAALLTSAHHAWHAAPMLADDEAGAIAGVAGVGAGTFAGVLNAGALNAGASNTGAFGTGMSGIGASGVAGMPGAGVPSVSAFSAGMSSAGTSGAGTSNAVGASNAGAPNAGTPNAGAPNAGTPNAGAPNAGTRNAGASNASASNAGTLNVGASNVGARNAGVSNADTPNAGASHAGVSNASASNAGTLNAGASNAGARNAGAPNASVSNAGTPNAGASDAGASNAGTPNASAPNTGTRNVGTSSASASNAGTPNAGIRNASISNAGAPGTGNARAYAHANTGNAYAHAHANAGSADARANVNVQGRSDNPLFGSADAPARANVNSAANPASTPRDVRNPADHRDRVGTVIDATPAHVSAAFAHAVAAAPIWQATPVEARADCLARAADLLEAQMHTLMGLIVREAGKSLPNAVAEIREAVDFLRYYAAQIRGTFSNDTHRPLGPVVCISPWNFPLAIFMGQVSAALAAGNTVLAKPAEQTPLIAAQAVRILREAGVPAGAVQLLPGAGETVGAALVADARTRAVMFTGSTEVARTINRTLATRLGPDGHPIPLIAETGGQNALIVDSSALAEQVVADVLQSAFDSAGQRCSALRVLCVQQEVAPRTLDMLAGAMKELSLGNPDRLSADVGPVIDADAKRGIDAHIAAMRAKGRVIVQLPLPDACARGTFVAPTLIEIERLDELQREVFGPVLHVIRYRRDQLDSLLEQIRASGYGLTLGIHTRIDETIAHVIARARVGNIYVNRNVIGAVVGVQPFGGEGLSGTGPKAGGPLYLQRLLATRPQGLPEALVQAFAAQATPGGGREGSGGVHDAGSGNTTSANANRGAGGDAHRGNAGHAGKRSASGNRNHRSGGNNDNAGNDTNASRNHLALSAANRSTGSASSTGSGNDGNGSSNDGNINSGNSNSNSNSNNSNGNSGNSNNGRSPDYAPQFDPAIQTTLTALRDWLIAGREPALAARCNGYLDYVARVLARAPAVLPGPTGERNTYSLGARGVVLCVPTTGFGARAQLAAALATGNHALFASAAGAQLVASLPAALKPCARVQKSADDAFDAVLFEGDGDELLALARTVAARPGPIVSVQGVAAHALANGDEDYALERLLSERSVSINTAAAGGNANLMTIG